MLVIYGTKTALIKSYYECEETCSQCQTEEMTITVFQDYFHVFWIPVFPSGNKSVLISCNACDKSIISDSISKKYAAKTKTPWYLYSLSVIPLALFVLFLIFVFVGAYLL